jgi:thioredoxin-related protein
MTYAVRRFLQLLLLCLALSPLTTNAADSSQFFDQSLGDFKADLADALKEGKKGMLIMFESEDCPFCRMMKSQILNREDVQTYFRKHFAIVAVDVLGSVTMSDFSGKTLTQKDYARVQKLRGTPTFVFVGPGGKEMTRYVGATRDAKEFLELGRYVAEGHWQTQGFGQFYPASRR